MYLSVCSTNFSEFRGALAYLGFVFCRSNWAVLPMSGVAWADVTPFIGILPLMGLRSRSFYVWIVPLSLLKPVYVFAGLLYSSSIWSMAVEIEANGFSSSFLEQA